MRFCTLLLAMNNKRCVFLVACALFLSFTVSRDRYRVIDQESFTTNERLEYRVHYGFINAAEAKVDVAKQKSVVNGRHCFKISVSGRTLGAFDLITRVRDTWRTYLDTSAIVPQMFYRNIQEGRYRREETVMYNHDENLLSTKSGGESKGYRVPDNVQDIISAYYYLRTLDYQRMSLGEVVEVNVFLEDQNYKLRVKYAGRDVIKTKFGSVRVFKLNPLLPDNKMFKGENSIRIWVSDDGNKIPVKAEADLWIGSLAIDLKEYKNLRTKPSWEP